MNVDTKTMLLIKFGGLRTVCVDGRSNKLLKLSHCQYVWCLGLCTHSQTCQLTTLCRQVMKLKIMNVDTKTMLLIKFGGLRTVCVDGRSNKLLKLSHCQYTWCLGLCTHSQTCQLTTLCLQVMKLQIMNVDTKTKLLIKFGGLGTVCVDGRSNKLLKLSHCRYVWCLGLCTHSQTCQLTTLCRQVMKLQIMNVDTKTKLLIKFGGLRTVCVDGRSNKLLKLSHCQYVWCLGLCTHSQTCQLTTLCRQVMKLQIMNVDTKTKLLIKFGGLRTVCVDGRSNKLLKLSHCQYVWCLGLCTHSQTCQLTTLCLQVMKLQIMNVDTKTKLLLKFGGVKTVCVDGRSNKLLKLSHCRYVWCLGLCTHSQTCQLTTLCLQVMKLQIMNVDTKTKLLLKFGGVKTVCVDGRSNKLLKLSHYWYTRCLGLCTHSQTCQLTTLCLQVMKL